MKTLGVYSTICKHGQVWIGYPGHCIENQAERPATLLWTAGQVSSDSTWLQQGTVHPTPLHQILITDSVIRKQLIFPSIPEA
jgi:hypothetical protein